MTLLRPHAIGVPVPTPTPVSKPYWDGCARGELLFQRCAGGHIVFNPASRCRVCLSTDLRWEQSRGSGEIYTWSVVWRPQTPEFQIPYVAAIVQLDEGYQMIANVVHCDHEDVHSGMRVVAVFHPISEEISLPYFAPA